MLHGLGLEVFLSRVLGLGGGLRDDIGFLKREIHLCLLNLILQSKQEFCVSFRASRPRTLTG